MRRRVFRPLTELGELGNTSAYAEKSTSMSEMGTIFGKYLRVCGEEPSAVGVPDRVPEIPPRMRRRVEPQHNVAFRIGNTSAYAEKSHK
ncbi:hypothetical protein HMPREF2547_06925 [Corynebacterium sp. HMSC055G02]|nr:hypothetical protein HMPREF2547_06925 [Corynebacterium sp. HMSC055G02]